MNKLIIYSSYGIPNKEYNLDLGEKNSVMQYFPSSFAGGKAKSQTKAKSKTKSQTKAKSKAKLQTKAKSKKV